MLRTACRPLLRSLPTAAASPRFRCPSPIFASTAATAGPSLHYALMSTFRRLVRFRDAASKEPLIGEPVDPEQDVGLAAYAGEKIQVELFDGKSVLAPGQRTGAKATVERILSPLAQSEIGTIRCIGLNVSPASSSPAETISSSLTSSINSTSTMRTRSTCRSPRSPSSS